MILDIIELKNNDWVPRNAIIKPKPLNKKEEDFTRVTTNNRTISQPIEGPSENCLNSNTQKVIKTLLILYYI